jgi:hypothetical protein
MATLSYVTGTGDNSYVACIIAPTPELGQSQTDFKSPLLRVLANNTLLPSNGLTFNVPSGAPQLTASLRDAAGLVPAGVTVTVTMPDGTVLDDPTTPYASGQVVLMQNGSLTDLVVANPQSGDWTVQVTAPNTSDEFQFFICTIPSADAESTIATTLESMLNPDAKTILGPEFAESWSCTLCKWGSYAIAGVICALAAAGVAYITAGAAPVGAAASLLNGDVRTVVLLAGAVAALSLGIEKVAEYICFWANSCDEPHAGVSWSGYLQVPGTVMADSPSAVVFNNQLYVFHQWNDNPLLQYNVLSSDGITWASTQSVGTPTVQITDGPSAVAFNGQLYCFYQGTGSSAGQLQFSVLSADGTTWGTQQTVPNAQVTDGPSAVVFNNQLYCFYQGTGSNAGKLQFSVLSADGTTWSNQQVANTNLSAGPSAVVSNGQLYCFHQGYGHNGQLWFNVLSASGTWAGDQQVPGTTMSADPSAVAYNNQIYCFYQGEGNNRQLHYNVLSPGNSWVGDRQVSGATITHGPSAVVFESRVFSGHIYCFHQGSFSQLWYDIT